MKKIIDQAFFEATIPAATHSTDEIFVTIQPKFAEAELKIKQELLGAIDPNNFPADNEMMDEMYARLVVTRAFLDAIPHLDLVLTPTGFGVVSNQNVAPASADRVAKLKHEVQRTHDFAYDLMIHWLANIPEWSDSPLAVMNINHLLYTVGDFCGYCHHIETRKELQDMGTKMMAAESHLQQQVDMIFFNHLLNQLRHANLSNEEHGLLTLMRSFINVYINNSSDVSAMKREAQFIENYLEMHIDAFPIYKNSQTYKAKHLPHYENKQEDSTFFFG